MSVLEIIHNLFLVIGAACFVGGFIATGLSMIFDWEKVVEKGFGFIFISLPLLAIGMAHIQC